MSGKRRSATAELEDLLDDKPALAHLATTPIKMEHNNDSSSPTTSDADTPSAKPKKKAKTVPKKGAQGPTVKDDDSSSSTPRRPKAKPAPPTLSPGASTKAIYAKMVIDTGLKYLDKDEVERATGLKATQQRELGRADGRGGVYNAMVRFADGL